MATPAPQSDANANNTSTGPEALNDQMFPGCWPGYNMPGAWINPLDIKTIYEGQLELEKKMESLSADLRSIHWQFSSQQSRLTKKQEDQKLKQAEMEKLHTKAGKDVTEIGAKTLRLEEKLARAEQTSDERRRAFDALQKQNEVNTRMATQCFTRLESDQWEMQQVRGDLEKLKEDGDGLKKALGELNEMKNRIQTQENQHHAVSDQLSVRILTIEKEQRRCRDLVDMLREKMEEFEDRHCCQRKQVTDLLTTIQHQQTKQAKRSDQMQEALDRLAQIVQADKTEMQLHVSDMEARLTREQRSLKEDQDERLVRLRQKLQEEFKTMLVSACEELKKYSNTNYYMTSMRLVDTMTNVYQNSNPLLTNRPIQARRETDHSPAPEVTTQEEQDGLKFDFQGLQRPDSGQSKGKQG